MNNHTASNLYGNRIYTLKTVLEDWRIYHQHHLADFMRHMARFAFTPEKLTEIRKAEDCLEDLSMCYQEGLCDDEDERIPSQDSSQSFIHPRDLAQDWQLPFYLDSAVECIYKSLFVSGSKHIYYVMQAADFVYRRRRILERWNAISLSA